MLTAKVFVLRKQQFCVIALHLFLQLWSKVIPLTFRRRDYGQYVDIIIKFVSGAHGDNTPFDGNGQTLAHAYFPQYGGDAHFDEDEQWTVNTPDGKNYFSQW